MWKAGRFVIVDFRLYLYFCIHLQFLQGKEWEQNWFNKANWEDLWTPFMNSLSRGKFSRDVCAVAKEELGLENIPGLEYPEPLQV